MVKIGIAISLYDKFEELSLLIDIIRSNWNGEYVISVCCNHPDGKKKIQNLDIDCYSQGEDINFSKSLTDFQKKINLKGRVLDSIKKSCLGAINHGADYVMHLHTDAWPLNEQSLLNLVDDMKKFKKGIGYRGMGLSKYRPDCPLGHVDDMFLLFNSEFVKKINFFNFNPLSILPNRLSIHGAISSLLVAKAGIENLYFYEDHTNLLFWDGEKHNPLFERAKPTMYDLKYKFLHVHSQSFINDYSRNIQAMYLFENGITNGKYISIFLDKYLINKDILLEEISNYENKLYLKLRFWGFPIIKFGRFGRDFNKMKIYLNSSFRIKLIYWFRVNIMSMWEETIKKWFGFELSPNYSVWPESLNDLYFKNLNQSDYPEFLIWWKKSNSE